MLIETYPNPFNDAILIKFNLENPASVVIEIYNIMGQKTSFQCDGYLNSGSYSYIFRPTENMSSGNYLIQVSCNNRSFFKKITYLK